MDISKFPAEAYIQSANPELGSSCPVVIYANNEQFIMKNQYSEEHATVLDACFFQELLCSFLALKLDIPTPEFVVLQIDKDFLDNNPELRFQHKIKEGCYFATKIIPNVENNLLKNFVLAKQNGQPRIMYSWNKFFKNIKNEIAIPRIITFDMLISNYDRYGNEGNILVAKNENEERHIYAIDHGHAFFGPFYKNQLIEKKKLLSSNNDPNNFIPFHLKLLLDTGQNQLNLGPIFSGLEQNIHFESNPFKDIIYDIENINDYEIVEMLKDIPEEWVSLGDSQKNDYLNFLSRQKLLVRHIIDQLALRDAFTNHTGGVLQWTTKGESSGTV
ncbi:HipA family kinase [Enterococcus sp. LJL51]|uniref:HipA family kinase n=1 Tax=Enterococcus sp. LJL51 TaxID=3416656 RepID=UPI003CF5B3CA